jgi:drug/metabolite transporter (DMT)-like permease
MTAALRLTPRLLLLLTLPPLLWAGNAVVGRMMVGQVPPLTLNLLRWGLTALLLLPIAWRALVPWRRIALRWPYLFALGLFGVGSYNSLQYLALVSSTPLNVTLVGASVPVWMLVIGGLFFGERPRTAQVVGAALSLAGVAVVLGRGSWAVLQGVHLVPGDLYVLAAVVGWAFYSWLLARPPAHMRGAERPRPDEGWDWAGMLLIQTLFGLLAAGTFTAGEHALGTAPIRWSLGVGLALLYTALGASIAAYRCWGLGVAEGGPALASIFVNLTPLFAALLSALLLGEWPQPYHAAAFALIVGGIAASVALDRRQKVPG